MKNRLVEEVDPGIKLFGRTIPVEEAKMRAAQEDCSGDGQQILCSEDQVQNIVSSEEEDAPSSQLDDLGSSSGSCEEDKLDCEAAVVKTGGSRQKQRKVVNKDMNSNITNTANNNIKVVNGAVPNKKSSKEYTPATGNVTTCPMTIQHKVQQIQQIHQQEQQEQQAQQEKPLLKRPEKLVPCPRCNSMETKFCYFNNYNMNQPRHFCKNCQRYWTAGGTLRNVPVGAGRRKSKHNSTGMTGTTAAAASSHSHQEQLKNDQLINHHHQTASKSPPGRMRLPPPILAQEICHFSPPETSPSGSMLTSLNSSSPGSMNSTIFNMHLAAAAAAAAASSHAPCDASVNVSPVGNSQLRRDWDSSNETATIETAKDGQSCKADATIPTRKEASTPTTAKDSCRSRGGAGNGFDSLFSGGGTPAWPCFPWNNLSTSEVANNNSSSSRNCNSAEMASWLSSVWAAGMPAWAPFAAASLWGPSAAAAAAAASSWNATPWSAAAAAAAAAAFAAAATANCSSSSPGLAKSLGKHPREKLECGRVEGCLWAPKTLRIDDPGEAAKSSIWATLGLDKAPPAASAVSPGAQVSSDSYKSESGHKQKLHSNPAALSRSMNFQENS